MKIIDQILDKVLFIIMVLSSAVLTVVTFAGVIARFVLAMPIKWSSDVTRWSFIYAVFFGASYAAKTNSHLNLDVILAMMPTKVRHGVEFLINILLGCFFIMICYLGYKFAISGLNQRMPYLQMPITVLYAALPINGAIMAYYYFKHSLEKLRSIISSEKEAEVK